MSLFLFLVGFATGALAVHPDVLTKCKQFYEAAAAAAPEQNPICTLIKITLDQALLRAEQSLRRSVVPVEGTPLWTVSYIIHGKLYRIRVRPVLGPLAVVYTPEARGKLSYVQ